MKYMVLILVAANAILSSQSVHGAECTFVGYDSCGLNGPSGATMVNGAWDGDYQCAYSECKIYTGLDGKKYAVSSCSDAPTGRVGAYTCTPESTATTHTVTAGGCTMTYVTCDCTPCTRCTSTSWTAHSTGYETMTEATCNCNGTCTQTPKYRCAAGYYGSSTNGTSGCTRCPSSNGVYGTSTAGSNTAITSCCLAGSNVSFSDTVGSGTYTDSSCCYSN